MSISIEDFIEKDKMSHCCGASMYELGDDYICTDCQEHCDAVSEEDI